jgi:hypothetical protein
VLCINYDACHAPGMGIDPCSIMLSVTQEVTQNLDFLIATTFITKDEPLRKVLF